MFAESLPVLMPRSIFSGWLASDQTAKLHATTKLLDGMLPCRVWGPKVEPWSRWRASAAQQQPLSFSLLFSSVASLLGSAGQANYAAANSALDAAAAADSAMGISSTSVRWGAWAGKVGTHHF
jgi:hypothetical protein